MRYTPDGTPMTTFSLATSRVYKTKDGERKQDTEWFRVVTWNQLAEQCNQFLVKGRLAYVEGRLRSRTWEGPDKTPRFSNEIIAARVLFLDKAPVPQGQETEPDTTPAEPEDLPF